MSAGYRAGKSERPGYLKTRPVGHREIRPSERRAMNKQEKAKAQEKKEAVIWDEKFLPDLLAEVEEYREVMDHIKLLEDRKAQLSPSLVAACILSDADSIALPGFRLTKVHNVGRPMIRPEKVVEKAAGLGLNEEQITELLEFSTETVGETDYPLVTRAKEE